MIIYALLGIMVGTITGLVPGLHSNNISSILILSPLFGNEAMIFILSMCITQSFVDFLPTIYLGTPESDNFEGLLPAQRMFLQGKAFEAATLTVFGGISAIIACALLFPFFIEAVKINAEYFYFIVPIVLIFTLVVFVFDNKTNKERILSLLVIVICSGQGFAFSGQIMPLIIGYFGIPTVIYSLFEPAKEREQKNSAKVKVKMVKNALLGVLGGSLVSIFPGIGSNVAARIIKIFSGKIKSKGYLVLIGSINTTNFFFSFPILILLGKERNGGMVFLSDKLILGEQTILLGLSTMLFSAGLGGIITIFLSKKASLLFKKNKIFLGKIISIFIMVLLVLFFSGISGGVALFFSAAVGFFVLLSKLKRSICMTSIITPVLFFYLFILI